MIAEMDHDADVVLEDDKEVADEANEAEIYKIDLDHANKVLSMQEDETEPTEVQEVVDIVTTERLITKVVIATSETITAATPSRRRKGVVTRDPEEESTTSTIIPAETKSKDKGKGILVEEPKPLKKKQQIKQEEQYARELHAKLNMNIDWDEAIDHVKRKAKEDPANVAGFKMDYFKGMSFDDIHPIFKRYFDSNVAFLQKTKEQIEKEESRALKRLNETLTEKAAKRQKLNEEVEELKRHLQIVPNEDDDVYTEATPLARKVSVFDYQIIEINNKPYYKIIRVDDTHQLYVSFLTLLRNFDREDLEALWSLVKEKHAKSKRIKREYSNARTLQQNKVAERKHKTLIKAARTMLADSVLSNTFWVEAVSTACYVLNRVLLTKSQNKTPYELLTGKIPIISYIRPFGCHVNILNTIDHQGKFAKKYDEGFLVGYSLSSKAFRVYNLETKRVKENLHINFLENKPNVAGKGPTWLFDLDYLIDLMNYQPITAENKANHTAGPKETNNSAGTQDNFDAGNSDMDGNHAQEYYVLPLWSSYTLTIRSTKAKIRDEKLNEDTDLKTNEESVDKEDQAFLKELERLQRQEKEANDAPKTLRKTFAQSTEDFLLQAARASSTNFVNTTSAPVNAASTPTTQDAS
nr:retrovirus-related Pol polyprotein from transposon TNT 1-94 [Tanacetum cinerariifolium]